MRLVKLGIVAVLVAGLAGCYTSQGDLLTDDNSVAPYARITFRDQDSSDASVLTRQGSAYVAQSDEGNVVVRFMALADRPDWYLTEVSGTDSSGARHLYTIVKVDLAAHTAEAYAAIADDGDAGPGLRQCEDSMICIDDLNAYISHAEAAIDAGADPDATYHITVE